MKRFGKLAPLIILVVLCVQASAVVAQCATGVNTGGGNCVPPDAQGMPGYAPPGGQPAAAPAPVWQNMWGAIVLDTKDGGKGTATDQTSKAAAVRVAMDECRASGARYCKVALTYDNECAAVAWGDQSYGVAADPSLDSATEQAIKSCSAMGSGCKTAYTACVQPKRIR